ncbi:MAG TPA: PilZ domain-containing protein [bacterium]|nr:PilZ domain-containing protein [bacterium]
MFGRFGVSDSLINRRRHARAPLNSKVILVSTSADGVPKVYYARDVSVSGLFIETVDFLKVGSSVRCLFPVVGTDKTVQARGKVVRVVEPVSDDDYVSPGIGIEFEDTPFESSILLENYVVNIKYVYEELLLLITMKNPDVDRIMYLVKKANIGEYRDFFDLKEKIKKVSFSLGILKDGLSL